MHRLYECCCCAHSDSAMRRDSSGDVRAEIDEKQAAKYVLAGAGEQFGGPKDAFVAMVSSVGRQPKKHHAHDDPLCESEETVIMALTSVKLRPHFLDADSDGSDSEDCREGTAFASPRLNGQPLYASDALGAVMELAVVTFSCRFFVMHGDSTNIINSVLDTKECRSFHGHSNLQPVVYNKPLPKSFGGDLCSVTASCFFPVARSMKATRRWSSGMMRSTSGSSLSTTMSRTGSGVSKTSKASTVSGKVSRSRESDECSELSNVQHVAQVEFCVLNPEAPTPKPQAEAGSVAIVCIVDLKATVKEMEDSLRDMVFRLVEIGRVPQSRRPARFIVCLNWSHRLESPETARVLDAWLSRYSFSADTSLHCPVYCEGDDPADLHLAFQNLCGVLQAEWSSGVESISFTSGAPVPRRTGLTTSPLPVTLAGADDIVGVSQKAPTAARRHRQPWIFSKESPFDGRRKWKRRPGRIRFV